MVVNSDPYLIIPILKSCAELASLYPRENPTVSAKLSQVVERIKDTVGDLPCMSLAFTDHTIWINDKKITNNQLRRPQSTWLITVVSRCHVAEIIISKQVDEDKMFSFGRILQDAAQKRISFDELKGRILQECGDMIQVTHISKPVKGRIEPSDPGEGTSEPIMASPDEDLSDASFKGQMKPSQGDSRKRLFELPDSQKQMLAKFIMAQIEQDRKTQLFQNLVGMLKDMHVFDQESAFLGVNSLNYSIDVLINVNQSGILLKLSEEIFGMLLSVPRDEIFQLAIESQLKIMKHFRDSQLLAPYLNGVRWFAEVSKLQSGDRRAFISKALFRLMDVSFTSFLLSQTSQAHALKEQIVKLFNHYPTELAESLFMVLFHSEKREERKKILTFLMKAGFAIQPLIMHHLKHSLKKESPWYIKRNLLFLFCKFPTNDLSPLIDELQKEPHARFQEQLLNACLRLKSPKAVEFGTGKMLNMSYDQMVGFLPVIKQIQNKAYDQVLIDHFHGISTEPHQVRILEVLQVLDTLKTRRLFEEILTAKKMVALKYAGMLRVEAAKGLYMSADNQLYKLLFGLKKDKEQMVRFWAQKYIVEKASK